MTQYTCEPTLHGWENFEIYLFQMAKNRVKLSTMVGENFEICLSQMTENHHLKSSTMVEEKFEICSS